MKSLSNKCSLILEGKEYTIDRLLIANDNRHIYLGHIENNNSKKYSIIKEIFSDCSGIIPLKRDSFTQQLIIDNEKLQQLHINQSEIVVEDLCEHELRINSIVFSEQDKETNSAYFFNFERKQSICNRVAYYVIDTVEGYTLDRLYDHLHMKDNINDADELVRIAVEKTKLAAEALGHLHQKGVLHLDIKPSNIYSVGGFDSEIMHIKLLDLGSAMLSSELGGAEFSGSTNGYCSPLMRRLQDPDIQSNRKAANELIGKLDFRDDIFGLARVLIFLLTGTTKEEDLNNLECNRYYKSLLQKIVRRASEGKTIRYEGKDRNCGDYRSCEDFIQALNELSDALNNKGLSEIIMLKKGREYFDGQLRNRKIDENMIPVLRSEDEETNCFATVTELCEELIAKKQNIFIYSQGGAGKSFMLYQCFLYFSNLENFNTNYVPLYIPLRDVFENIKEDEDKENAVYKYILKHYTGADDVSKIKDYLNISEAKILVLADGLNEITKNRQSVISNLEELSKKNNVSVIVTSRYREMQFAYFSQYELADLDERIIRSKVNDFDSLPIELKELLGTPFNVNIYTGLSEESKHQTIRTASDLIEANINDLKKKLFKKYTSEVEDNTIDYLFDVLLPVFFYYQSIENSLSFSIEALEIMAVQLSELFNQVTDNNERIHYALALANISNNSAMYTRFAVGIMSDNDIIMKKDVNDFEIAHENVRNWFGAKGWMIIAKKYKLFNKHEDKDIYLSNLFPPVIILDYMIELIKKENERSKRDYFDSLFDHTTRFDLHNENAAVFNEIIVHVMQSIKADLFHRDFSSLDLSRCNFSGKRLVSCDFSNALLSETSFLPFTTSHPIGVWNNDDMVIAFFPEGVLRYIWINTGVTYTVTVSPFDQFFIKDEIIVLFKSKIDPTTNLSKKAILFGEINKYNLYSHKKIETVNCFIPLDDVLNDQSSSTNQLSISISILCEEFRPQSISFDESGRLFVFTHYAVFCFSESNFDYLGKYSFPFGKDTNSIFYTYMDYNNPYNRNKKIARSITSIPLLHKYSVVFFNDNEFFVVKINPLDSSEAVSFYGPFCESIFSKYGLLIGITVHSNSVITLIEQDNASILYYFIPETGLVLPFKSETQTDVKEYSSVYDHKKFFKVYSLFNGESTIITIPESQVLNDYFNDFKLSCTKNTICLLSYSKQKYTFAVMPLSGTSNNKLIKPCVSQTYNIVDKFFIICQVLKDRFLLETDNGRISITYDIHRHKLMKYSDEDESFIPPDYDEVSYSLIGTEQYKYSTRYLRDLDYQQHNYITDDLYDSFHSLAIEYNFEDCLTIEPGMFRVASKLNDVVGLMRNQISRIKRSLFARRDNNDNNCDSLENNSVDQEIPNSSKKVSLRDYYNKSFGRATFGRICGLNIFQMICVYNRYIMACCETLNFSEKHTSEHIVLLFLDLKTNKLTRIDTGLSFDYRHCLGSKYFIWMKTDESFDGEHIKNLFYMDHDALFEVSVNLRRSSFCIEHCTILLPNIELENCLFNNTDLVLHDKLCNAYRQKGISDEVIKERFLNAFRENNITNE